MRRALALGVAVNVVVVTIVAIGLFGFHVTPAFAQQTDTLAPLQGRWMVTAGEHNGAPMDALNGGVMAIDGAAFETSTASGNVLTGTLEVEDVYLVLTPPVRITLCARSIWTSYTPTALGGRRSSRSTAPCCV